MKISRFLPIVLFLSWAPPAYSELVIGSDELPESIKVIDFSNIGGIFHSTGPHDIGADAQESVIWTSMPRGSLYDRHGTAGFGHNNPGWSRATGRESFSVSAIDPGGTVFMNYYFEDGPVAIAGGFMNYSTGPYNGNFGSVEVLIQALGVNGEILESYNLLDEAPITTPGHFRGISRSQNDISSLRVQSDGRFFGLDELTFVRGPIFLGGFEGQLEE